MMSSGRAVTVLRNDGDQRGNWLKIDLRGVQSNRDGIGAKVYLMAGGRSRMQQVKAGSGYLSTSEKALLFGLGASEEVERVEIRWPSGQVQIVENLQANQTLQVVESIAP
jgi:hypothetical protein